MRWLGLALALLVLFAVRRSLLTRLRRRSVGPTSNLSDSGYQFISGAINPFFSTVIVVTIIAAVSVVIAVIFMGNEGVKIDEIIIEPEPASTLLTVPLPNTLPLSTEGTTTTLPSTTSVAPTTTLMRTTTTQVTTTTTTATTVLRTTTTVARTTTTVGRTTSTGRGG